MVCNTPPDKSHISFIRVGGTERHANIPQFVEVRFGRGHLERPDMSQ